MFPIGDDDSARRVVPAVTYALIVINVLFFFVNQTEWRRLVYRTMVGRPPQADSQSGE